MQEPGALIDCFLSFAPLAAAVWAAAGAFFAASAQLRRLNPVPVPIDCAENRITIAAAVALIHPGGLK